MKKAFKLKILVSIFLLDTNILFAKQHEIIQKGKKFNTKEISIKTGDELKILNMDDTTHHLMYKVDGKRISHKQKSGDPEGTKFIQKFVTVEKLTIRCAIHPKMKLKVEVTK